MTCGIASPLAPNENIPSRAKNMFLFSDVGPVFSNYFLLNLKKFFNVIECFDTTKISAHKKYYLMATSFSMDKEKWRKEYYKLRDRYITNPKTFVNNSNKFKKHLSNLNAPIDVVLQVSSLFDTTLDTKKIPHAVYIDYTTNMAIKEYQEWAMFESKDERNKWIELETNLFRSTNLIMTFNAAARESIICDYGIDKNKVFVVGSGTSISDIPDIEKDYNKKNILFCGRDFERHGGDIVLKAFPIVKKEFPEASLLVVGSVVNSNLDGLTCIKGLSIEKLHEKMLESTIIAMPAEVGGLQSMTEAMAYKCVCIAARGNPHIPNLVINGDTGLLIERGDADALAREIINLFTDRDLLIRLSKQGQQRVRQFFTWEGVCRNIYAYLKKLFL